jgi:uncharacterized protein YbjT (DUF2867 family)
VNGERVFQAAFETHTGEAARNNLGFLASDSNRFGKPILRSRTFLKTGHTSAPRIVFMAMTNDSTYTPPAGPLKIVVIGGSGLIGSRVTRNLRSMGHSVLTASPSSGVNTVTGEGLAPALDGADVVVDVANSPSFEDNAVMAFFRSAGTNIAAAEKAGRVKHHVALSVVGTDRLQASGYFRAKLVQEELIQQSGIPYTIVRATQFFEFVPAITQAAMSGQSARLSSAMMQPIAADDVATAVTNAALSAPRNEIVDLAGPDPIRMNELVRQYLAAQNDPREVITDDAAGYFGTPVDDRSLTPGGPTPLLGSIHFADWLRQTSASK